MKINPKIFGYGSLMNIYSLRKTIPNVKESFPAFLENYICVFETKSTTRFTKNGNSVSVLNLKKNPNTFVNGVCFEISKEYFNNLKEREFAYELKEIWVKSFITKKSFQAFIFIDKSFKTQEFLFNESIQIDYLKICIKGAKDFGEDFYRMFLNTTLINGNKLKNIKKLNYLF